MQGALYFPTIEVPPGPWLMRTLLYWDQVGTIVPGRVRSPGSNLDIGSLTTELFDSGLLRRVEPSEGHFNHSFEQWLETLPDDEVARRRSDFKHGAFREIHFEKWFYYGGGLDRAESLGLVERSDQYGWLRVEARTAAEFMAGLALGLCHPQSELLRDSGHAWFPVTDSADASDALFAAQPAGGSKLRQLRLRMKGELLATELRSDVLLAALPVPTSPISVQDLLNFRERHGTELPRLRRELERRLDEIVFASDPVLGQRLRDRLIDEVNDLVAPAAEHLRRSGFRAIEKSSLLRVLRVLPITKGLVQTVVDAAGLAAGSDKFESEPLAYLAFARAELLTPRRHRSNSSETLVDIYRR